MIRWPLPLAFAALLLAAQGQARAQDADAVERLLPAPGVSAVPNPMAQPSAPPVSVPGMAAPGMVPQQPQQTMGGGFQQQFNGFPQAPASARPTADSPGARQNTRDAQFQRALREALPMSPDEVTRYRRESEGVRRATVAPLGAVRPVTRSIRLSLKPGEQTPVVHVKPGSVSSLTFSDITGAPWPVLSVVTGNPSAYVAQSAGEEGKTNIIVVSAIQDYYPSNMLVTLVGHPVPVSIALSPEGNDLDYRVDVAVMNRGPNASQDVVGVSNMAPTNDLTMVKFLDGVPPDGARRMGTTSSEVEAWKFEDVLYIRTRGDVLSPAYTARTSNVSGVHVFTMAESPVVIVSTDGRLANVRLTR